ncbi:MAG: hypothetical protein M3R53_08440 [Candidatus Eremiobacteraeota bacterium]|nr:hypothetical protein [Candidatus Eremiobacteraeota bacterium]
MGRSGLQRLNFARACFFATCVALPPHATSATTAPTAPPVAPAQCDAVDANAAATILGYPVGAPDATSRAAGICFFPTQSISENGIVSYAIITLERLPQRRAYFTALARMCAGVSTVAPRAGLCATYVKLARVENLEDYFTAQTSDPDAVPVPALGDAAFVSHGTLYVRRAGAVFEVVVRRERQFDIARSTGLATLLLQRVSESP